MNKGQILKCLCDLRTRIAELEAQVDSDNQTLSLLANQLSISNGNSVDLSVYLDNTDAQVLSVAAVAGGTNLSLSNGNTVFIPDGTGTDDQILTLLGNDLSIEDGNSVDLSAFFDNTDNQVLSLASNVLSLTSDDGTDNVNLSVYLDNTDSQILSFSTTATDLVLNISGGNSISIPLSSIDTDDQVLSLLGNNLTISDGNTVDLSQFEETLTTTSEVRGYTWAAGFISNAGATLQGVGNHGSSSQILGGRYQVNFGSAHPNGANYAVVFGGEEDAANRDSRDIHLIEGSRTATGFQVMITTGDNGGGADTYVNEDFSYSVFHEDSFLITATLT